MMQSLKVVTSEEMARVERLAYATGFSEADFMEKAGKGVAGAVLGYLKDHPEKKVTVFVGKGNNGADGYVAAVHLMQKGVSVEVIQLFGHGDCSPLCKVQSERFQKMGGVIHPLQNHADCKFPLSGLIIDAILGTGFKGKAEGLVAEVIEKINASHLPVFSIDIPSGLCGNTGLVQTVAVHAHYTVYLELPKLGFFLHQGWDHVGILIQVIFGLPKAAIEKAHPSALLAQERSMKDILPPVKRTRHKYEAGYVLAIAGSESMPGAAILSCSAVLHAGAGMVRLFHPEGIDDALISSPAEIIKEAWDFKDMHSLSEQMKKARSILIGPGLGRDSSVKKMIKMLLGKITVPAVIDADALFFLAENPSWTLPKNTILTPHVGEMRHLLSRFDCKEVKDDFFASCALYAEKKQVILILKGAPTFIFFANRPPLIVPFGDPGMATAGSGDVLTGVIAALLAQKCPSYEAAALGVYIHGKAGEYAASEKTSYSMIASDITENLSKVFASLLKSE